MEKFPLKVRQLLHQDGPSLSSIWKKVKKIGKWILQVCSQCSFICFVQTTRHQHPEIVLVFGFALFALLGVLPIGAHPGSYDGWTHSPLVRFD